MTPPAPASLRRVLPAAGTCVAAAALLARAAVRRDPGLHVPPTVALAVAGAVAAAGAALLARGLGRDRAADGLAGLFLLAMAGVGGWLALGPGARRCTNDVGLPAAGGALGCRLAFGVGAAITAALAVWALAGWWRQGRATPGARS